jgi:hypothetical protein
VVCSAHALGVIAPISQAYRSVSKETKRVKPRPNVLAMRRKRMIFTAAMAVAVGAYIAVGGLVPCEGGCCAAWYGILIKRDDLALAAGSTHTHTCCVVGWEEVLFIRTS